MTNILKIWFTLIFIGFILPVTSAHVTERFRSWCFPGIDSSYIETFSKDIVVRFYSSNKYINQTISDRSEHLSLFYKPSNEQVIGSGFTYKWLSINLGIGFPFSTADQDRYGKDKHFDLQTHIFLKRFTIDLLSGFYKGQYLNNTSQVLSVPPVNAFYYRNDIISYSIGFGIYTNFNPSRFSYRAFFDQSEIQKRSAGQPIAGLEVYYAGSNADSSMVPSGIKRSQFFDGFNFNRWQLFTCNLAGGYAYSLVIFKKMFVMLSLTGGVGLGMNQLFTEENGRLNKIRVQTSINEKFSAGYNFDRIYMGVSWIKLYFLSPTAIQSTHITWNPGVVRFNLAYRFPLSKTYEIRPWKWRKWGNGNHTFDKPVETLHETSL